MEIVYTSFTKSKKQKYENKQKGEKNESNRQNRCKSRERERESCNLENETSIVHYALLNIHARDG